MSNKKYTYLIVEDDPAFIQILKIITSKISNITLIDACDNTTSAALNIDLHKPDIVLLDVNISGLEGPEILEITEHQPKAIVISGHPETVMDEYDIEYVEFIQKPLRDAEQLINAINRCIEEIELK